MFLLIFFYIIMIEYWEMVFCFWKLFANKMNCLKYCITRIVVDVVDVLRILWYPLLFCGVRTYVCSYWGGWLNIANNEAETVTTCIRNNNYVLNCSAFITDNLFNSENDFNLRKWFIRSFYCALFIINWSNCMN